MTAFLLLAVVVDLIKALTTPPPGQAFANMQPGIVVLGVHHAGPDETILGLLLAGFLFVYAGGIWRMKRYAMWVAWIYAAYVLLNVILFAIRNPAPPTPGAMLFAIVYVTVAVALTSAAAIVLTRRRAELN